MFEKASLIGTCVGALFAVGCATPTPEVAAEAEFALSEDGSRLLTTHVHRGADEGCAYLANDENLVALPDGVSYRVSLGEGNGGLFLAISAGTDSEVPEFTVLRGLHAWGAPAYVTLHQDLVAYRDQRAPDLSERDAWHLDRAIEIAHAYATGETKALNQ